MAEAFSADDYRFMARALQLARQGLYSTDPNPRVGCVLVNAGRIVGEGYHVRAGTPHAEIHALHAAAEAARGATAYVTLEPCCHFGRTPPCTTALIAAGVSRVVAAMSDPNPRVAGQGLSALRTADIVVDSGLLAAEAQALNPGFIHRMTQQRPFVRLKLAMSLDGRTALASGESAWITGEAARRDVQHWRARSSVILTGVGTVLADDPRLDVRLAEGMRQPLRVIVDRHLRTPPTARILQPPGAALLLTTVDDPAAHAPLLQAGAQITVVPPAATAHGVDLTAVLSLLAQQEANEVHVECGATLAGAFLEAGLIDELVLYIAPVVLGDKARGLFTLPVLTHMADRHTFQTVDRRCVGDDVRWVMTTKS